MIYECTHCRAPQAPGSVSCPNCGAQFHQAIPDDATLPEDTAAASVAEAPPEEVGPEMDSSTLSTTPPQPVTPVAPLAPPPPQTAAVKADFPLRTALLIGIPIAVVAIVIFFIVMNSGNPETTATPPPAGATYSPAQPTAAGHTTAVSLGSSSSHASSTYSSPVASRPGGSSPGGSSPSSGSPSSSTTAASTGGGGAGTAGTPIVGKWVTKALDFYQFDGGGSGTRGNLKGTKPTESFSWITVSNQLILYSQQDDTTKKETLAYSNGSDGNTIYIRQPDGRYQEYSRMDNGG